MKKCISILVFSLLALNSYGQHRLELRLSNNVTGMPLSAYPSLFYSNFHPGLDAGIQHRLNSSEKHQWAVSGNLGLFYHRFIQTGVKIYPGLDYAYVLNPHWKIEASLDLGYIMAFNNVAVLELQDDGNYESQTLGRMRSQFMVGWRIGASYTPSADPYGISYTMAFGTFLQGPYVSGYVPLLPYNSFSLGIDMPINL